RTEDFCLHPDPTQSARSRGNRQVTAVTIEPSAEGATGTAPLGNGGRYEDVYVKPAAGWRFRSRTVVMPPARRVGPGRAPSRLPTVPPAVRSSGSPGFRSARRFLEDLRIVAELVVLAVCAPARLDGRVKLLGAGDVNPQQFGRPFDSAALQSREDAPVL